MRSSSYWRTISCNKQPHQATNTSWRVARYWAMRIWNPCFKTWLIEHDAAVLKVARAYTLTTEDCQDLAREILLLLASVLADGVDGRFIYPLRYLKLPREADRRDVVVLAHLLFFGIALVT